MTLLAAFACLTYGYNAGAKTAAEPKSRELDFKVADLTLEGTFEAPAGAGKFPALLLLPGSGPTDRDGNSGLGIVTDVLKDVADALAQNGIASYRFDKRAIRHYSNAWPKTPGGMNRFFGWKNFVGDAKSALAVLESQPEVDAKRVGMLGHSEGALISLQVGADLSGKPGAPTVLVLLGSTGRPMGLILHEQIARALKKQGATPQIAQPYIDYTDAACKALAEGKPLPPNTPQGLAALFNPTTMDLMGAYCRIDPADLAKAFPGPVLVINGKNDTQVSAKRDTPLLVAALKSRSEGSVNFFIVPDASHCLKSTKSGDDDAMSGPIVPGVLENIVEFVKLHL
jgi:dienelactone hydrolase